jgi:TP901 family phage tail tape measure protein
MARDETIKLSLIDGVTRTLGQIQQGVSGVGASLTKLNQGAELAAKAFGLIGSAASSIGNAVQGAADIESALARVSDITQATAAEQVALQEAVQAAVSTLGVSADQAAAALVLMAEDGFSATEAVGSLNTVLAFAKANAQDAATATQALGGVLDTFGEKPAIIGELADQLTAAARAAGVGTSTLQSGLAAIGVQAEQAGLGVSEATAALAALASRGIEGTQAAKQLGTVLTELNNPASRAGKALEDAGLSGKSFAQIVDVLSKDAAKAAPILEALGNRPRAALRVLLADGGSALKEFGAIVDGASGASERAASVIDETFNGALSRLQASIANLRNEFLSPILQPLADEAVALAEKINALGDSPQFARIRDQFQELATNAIRSVGDLIEQADLEAWAGDVADFAADAKTAFDGLVVVVKTTAGAIRDIGAAIDLVRDAQKKLHDMLGENSRPVDAFLARQKALREQSKLIGDAFGAAAEKALRLGEAVGFVGKEASSAAGDVAGMGAEVKDAAEDLRQIPKAAKLTEVTLEKLAGGAEQAAIGLERLRLATLTSAIAALARENLQGTDTFRALVAEVAKTEASIAKMQEAIDKAKGAQKDLSDQTDSAANSLRNFASAARDADDGAGSIADSLGDTGDRADNAADSVISFTLAVDEMTAAALRADSSQGQGTRLFIESINRMVAATEEINAALDERIARERRVAESMSETAALEAQLTAQYGNSGERVKELAELITRNNQARERSLELTERETAAIERQTEALQAQAGAINYGRTPEATGGATGVRPSSAGTGSRGEPAQIVVNVTGAPTDAAGWREIVNRFIVPELARVERLSR